MKTVNYRRIGIVILSTLTAISATFILLSASSAAAIDPTPSDLPSPVSMIQEAETACLPTGGIIKLPDLPSNSTPCTVTSAADSGPGTLRQCLLAAQAGDTITFDPTIFPPSTPTTIALTSGSLPALTASNLTIHGSDAGVIIDGAGLTYTYADGLRIASHGNVIRGLTIQNFPSDGVDIRDGAQGNKIEHCVIRGNGKRGVRIDGNGTTGNTIIQNSITQNDGSGIVTSDGGNIEPPPPLIHSVVTGTDAITIAGFALPGTTVELFADPGGEGAVFLGTTMADSKGYFTEIVTGVTLGDDNVTATATDVSGNTSMFTCYPIPVPSLIWPLSGSTTPDGPFSSPFGPRLMASEGYRYDWHRGIDIPASIGTIAYAVADGQVRCAGYQSCGYSDRIVQIEHEDGCYYCNYLHMTTTEVITGDVVTQGMAVGTTGVSTSGFPHLHFEIRRGGYYQRNAINPFVYLPYADTSDHAVAISGAYVHTSGMTPTVTARVIVTAPAAELDFNRLVLAVADGTQELDWRAADLHVFNLQKSTIAHPEVLDTPYIDDICIMPAKFNTTSAEYRIDLVFYGLRGNDSIALNAQAIDVHSNAVSTTTSPTVGLLLISPGYAELRISPGMTGTLTHVVTHTSTTTQTIALHAVSAQGEGQWNVQATPSSVTLSPGESATITIAVAVSENVPVGTVNCVAVTAASQDGSQAIAVDIVTASRMSYLPIVLKSYSP